MKTYLVTATDFKAKCLSLLSEIELHGESITITRRGKPVAVLGPPERTAWKSPKDTWGAKVKILGDIVNQNWSDAWEVVGEE